MDDRTRLPFGVLATAATLLSLVSCYATRIELWIPALREPIAESTATLARHDSIAFTLVGR